jgi:hypothetical protein
VKKVTLLFVLGAFLIGPQIASASILDDIVNWLVPEELKPQIVVPVTQRGTGGVLITPEPAVVSGDTTETYYLPSLGSRSFAIENGGDVDLYLNKSNQLSYSAVPAQVVGDLPAAYTLPRTERTIIISNPSTTTNYFLSKSDLSIKGTGSTTVVASVLFISNSSAKAEPVTNNDGQSSIASLSHVFTLNNATNKDVYISKLINPLSFVSLSPVAQASTSVKFIEADPLTILGDATSTYVVPAGKNRKFIVTGIIDNTNGTSGAKRVSITGIKYSNNPTLAPLLTLNDQRMFVNLTTEINLGNGLSIPVRNPVVVPVSTTTTVTPVQPNGTTTVTKPATTTTTNTQTTITTTPIKSPIITTSPSVAASPSVTTSPSSTASPSGSVTTIAPRLIISYASTTIGLPIVDNGQIVGYPVTFTFNAQAVGKTVYLGKLPSTAFATIQTGFGTVLPMINSISSVPRTGDGGGYYLISASSTRTFQAFAVLKNDGITKTGTQTFQISEIRYGFKSTALAEASTTERNSSLKATVKLAPFVVSIPAQTPAQTTSPSPTQTSTASPSPTQTSTVEELIALCYAVPSNPITGDIVTWQVMQSGGSGTPKYTWTGTDSLSGSTATLKKAYSATGKKDALVSVVVGTQSVAASCYVNVSAAPVTATPDSTPTGSPTGTPSSTASPSGSGTSFRIDPSKTMISNVLYGIGEFLDSILFD